MPIHTLHTLTTLTSVGDGVAGDVSSTITRDTPLYGSAGESVSGGVLGGDGDGGGRTCAHGEKD